MAKVSISKAIKLSGVSRSTFYKSYINKGLISVEDERGKKRIDTSELIRVFGELVDHTPKDSATDTNPNNIEQPNTTALEIEIKMLKDALNAATADKEWLKAQNQELNKKNNDLMIRLLPAPYRIGFGIFDWFKRGK